MARLTPAPTRAIPKRRLDCRFGGPNIYHGITVIKPFIGKEDRIITHGEFTYVKYINHATAFLTIAAIVCGMAIIGTWL